MAYSVSFSLIFWFFPFQSVYQLPNPIQNITRLELDNCGWIETRDSPPLNYPIANLERMECQQEDTLATTQIRNSMQQAMHEKETH